MRKIAEPTEMNRSAMARGQKRDPQQLASD